MAAEPKKKRQHYVPKLILRRFSPDERRVTLLVLDTGKRIEGASLKDQCYEDYFYGKDEEIEKGFAAEEGKFSSALGDLTEGHLEGLGKQQIDAIRFFVHYQGARTRAAAEEVNDFNEAMAKSILSKDSRFADLDMSKVSIRTSSPQYESLYYATTTLPLVLDLAVKFIVAEKKLGFVLSDHPVLTCNQFAEHHPVLCDVGGSTGLALKGLQLFLPVSPRVCIALYDPSTYEYGSPSRHYCRVGLRDIRLLNALQAATAHACLYFDPTLTPNDELRQLQEHRRKNAGWRKPKLQEGRVTPRGDGMTGQVIWYQKPELRIGAQFGFARVTDRDTYRIPRIPPRSREIVEFAEQYHAFIQGMVEKKRAERAREEDPTRE